MDALNRVKRDHHLLRAKLEMLKGAVSLAPESWLVLREGCLVLSHLLQAHHEREARVMAACRPELEREEVPQAAAGHQDRLQSFRILSRSFIDEGPPASIKEVCEALTAAVDGLRDDLHAQEDVLFPVLERVVEQREGSSVEEQPPRPVLSEEQTVNNVLSHHPETKTIFERFSINPAYEGYDCLDEVAWRHGMQAEELMGYLAQELVVPPVHLRT